MYLGMVSLFDNIIGPRINKLFMVLFWVLFFYFQIYWLPIGNFCQNFSHQLATFYFNFCCQIYFSLAMGTKGLQLGALVMHDSGVIL